MENNEFHLLPSQELAFKRMKAFVDNPDLNVFILRGYAGTGKTTLMRTLIQHFEDQSIQYCLLASTGRAAKILSNTTQKNATTVHGLVYKYAGFNQDMDKMVDARKDKNVDESGQFYLVFSPSKIEQSDGSTHYYIVDEASMISDKGDKHATQALFGSGRLLSDLLKYDEYGKFIFVGDPCQLPPVNQSTSPALSAEYIRSHYSLSVDEVELTDIVRQAKGNDIVVAAQKMRRLYYNPLSDTIKWAKFPLKGCKNIHLVSSQTELIRLYIDHIKSHGYNDATLLTLSNSQCNTTTQFIRPSLGLYSNEVQPGDLLLVTQNNYISRLMNGDLVKVLKV